MLQERKLNLYKVNNVVKAHTCAQN